MTNGERIFRNFTYEDIIDSDLSDGDEIYVHNLANTPRNIVKVIGELANTGSIAYEKDLKL